MHDRDGAGGRLDLDDPADRADRYRLRLRERLRHAGAGVREFLTLHYRLAARQDTPYWRDAHTRELPGDLAERIEQWRTTMPDAESVFPHYHGFEPYSYAVMLLGLGGLEAAAPPALRLVDETAAQKEFALVRSQSRELVDRMPGQEEYFAHLRRAVTTG